MEDNQTLLIQQRNVSADTLRLQWELINEAVPAKWEASVCDNSFCYTSLVAGGAMMPVAPGGAGKLLIRLTPHVTLGTAVIRYTVWDMEMPGLRDTLTYIFTASAISSVFESVLNDDRSEDAENAIRLYTAAGEFIRSFTSGRSLREQRDVLAPGCYFACIQYGSRLVTRRLILF